MIMIKSYTLNTTWAIICCTVKYRSDRLNGLRRIYSWNKILTYYNAVISIGDRCVAITAMKKLMFYILFGWAAPTPAT